ncbi:MAG: DUF4007 family protein [Bacteroidales bacterium]|nr:DUF4007 family protein [Bacteroidales bacterium]
MAKPIFSGHETFSCKLHWLKRGYEFVVNEYNFNDEEAVVRLGVGKNMVASIKYYMKSFGLLNQDGDLEDIARKLFDSENGFDPFLEDIGSLYLLHFLIVNTNHATAYKTTFIDYHSQRNTIEKNKLQNFIKHICFDNAGYQNIYNENTVKKDINVLIHNYYNKSISNIEDSNTIFAQLNLIRETEEGTFVFNYENKTNVPPKIFLYALLHSFHDNNSISFEMMRDLALIFCLTNNDLLNIIKQLCIDYSGILVFSDVAGIKELQIKGELSKDEVLKNYYIG